MEKSCAAFSIKRIGDEESINVRKIPQNLQVKRAEGKLAKKLLLEDPARRGKQN